MATLGIWKNDFPIRITLGKKPNVLCLCPGWMCWMPFLADGEDVKA